VVVLEGGRGIAMLAGAVWLAGGLPSDRVWSATAVASVILAVACALFAIVLVRREHGRLAATARALREPDRPVDGPRQLHFLGVLLATNLYLWLCPVVLERAGPIEEVGLFNVAMQFPALISFLSTSLELALMGRIAEAHAAGDLSRLQPSLRAAARLVAVTVLPAAAILFVLRDPLLALFGEPYRAASTAMGLAVLAQVVSVACGPAGYLVLLGGRERLNMAVMTASSLAGLAVLVALADSLGHVAAAFGFLVATAAANLTLALVCLSRLGVDPTLAAALAPAVRKGGRDAA
jgi:O-antigen/teichoic acid export membrane protein